MSAETVAKLTKLNADLQATYTDEGVVIWLFSAQSWFAGKSPMEVLSEGYLDAVCDRAAQLATGAF